MKSLAMFQEVPFSHPNLPGIDPISGPVDYLSPALPQDIPLAITRGVGGVSGPVNPLFVLVEAKRSQTFEDVSSNAQLMAQLLAAQYQDL